MAVFEVLISTPDKNLLIQDLFVMGSPFFELDFPFQIHISGQQEILVNVVV